MSGTSSSSNASNMTIDIRPMIEDVSQVMTKHITNILSGVIGEYTIYKETHDTIMGLPCVRKLQDRIAELEDGTMNTTTAHQNTAGNSREDEISQLQNAIVDLNRYIHALESKVDMKTVSGRGGATETVAKEDEETVKLEIREEDEDADEDGEGEGEDEPCIVTSTHKNVIITAAASVPLEDEDADAEEAEEAEEADAEDAEEAEEAEDADAEEAEEADAEDADAEEADAEEADAEEAEEADAEEAEAEEEAEEEAEDADAEEAVEEEAEEAEEEAEEAEEEAEEAEEEAAEEAEIEVSEVKIKGKTYFTTDAVNGIIYACVDEDVGDEVGVFKNGVAVFNKSKK